MVAGRQDTGMLDKILNPLPPRIAATTNQCEGTQVAQGEVTEPEAHGPSTGQPGTAEDAVGPPSHPSARAHTHTRVSHAHLQEGGL